MTYLKTREIYYKMDFLKKHESCSLKQEMGWGKNG